MLKLLTVIIVTMFSLNSFATKQRIHDDLEGYRRCLKQQARGHKIACHKPATRQSEQRTTDTECVITENEQETTKTCHGQTWVRVDAQPDGTLGETGEVEGQEVVDAPTQVLEYLEGEIADTEIPDADLDPGYVGAR